VIKGAAAKSQSQTFQRLIVARDRSVLGRGSIRKVKSNFVYVTPAPVLRRIIAFDDRVRGGPKMLGSMPVGGVVAAADVTASSAEAQVNPGRTGLQTFLATSRARRDIADRIKMRAGPFHRQLSLLSISFSRHLYWLATLSDGGPNYHQIAPRSLLRNRSISNRGAWSSLADRRPLAILRRGRKRDVSGKPWQKTTICPSPCPVTCNMMPTL
jgi:hypothetical protein